MLNYLELLLIIMLVISTSSSYYYKGLYEGVVSLSEENNESLTGEIKWLHYSINPELAREFYEGES